MRSCYECCCMDTSDNPVIGIEDDYGNVEEWVCMECFCQRDTKKQGFFNEDTDSDNPA